MSVNPRFSEKRQEQPSSNGRRIAIVDDDPDFSDSLREILEDEGYLAACARSEAQALEMIEAVDAQVALIDVQLGLANGLDLLTQLKARAPLLLCISMTAFASVDRAVLAMRNGAYDFLQKPFSPDQLIVMLDHCFDRLDADCELRESERARRASESRYRTLVESASVGIQQLAANGKLLNINAAGAAILGEMDPGRLLGLDFLQFISPIDREQVRVLCKRALRHREVSFEARLNTRGRTRTVAMNLVALHSEASREATLIGHMRDITGQREAEEALRDSEFRFRDFAETAADWLWEMDDGMRLTYSSGRVREITGVDLEDLLGSKVPGLVGGDAECGPASESEQTERRAPHAFSNVDSTWRRPDGKTRNLQSSGKLILDGQGGFQGYRGTTRDVTHAKRLSDELLYHASHDPLTNLLNRREFERRLNLALGSARNDGAEHALCYLDLDQFKVVNDTCSHQAGDELLRQLALTLARHLRHNDTLARLGGDEFGVLIEHCAAREAQQAVRHIHEAINAFRFRWNGQDFRVGASVGLVSIDADSSSSEEVLRMADSACYSAKEAGRNRIHVYREDDAGLLRRQGQMEWVPRITRALHEGRLRLVQQCAASLGAFGDEPTYCELLVRCVDERGELILPEHFLPAAERFGIATRIDQWVVDFALEWLAGNLECLEREYVFAVNLSGQSLGDARFLDAIEARMRDASMLASHLCFEVTETAAIENVARARRFMDRLSDYGCRFALDDFGSGLSSFGYLRSLPVDYVKIDGVFVRDMAENSVDAALVRAIHEVATVMDKRTVAECVETESALQAVVKMNIHYAQGYYVADVGPLDDLLGAGPVV